MLLKTLVHIHVFYEAGSSNSLRLFDDCIIFNQALCCSWSTTL